MTVSEMLDMLEGRIARLGAERARLASALEDAEQRLKAVGGAASRKRARPERGAAKSRRGARKAKPAPAPKTAAVAAGEPAVPAQPVPHPLGKRLALGRGLAQLRARTAAPPHSAGPHT